MCGRLSRCIVCALFLKLRVESVCALKVMKWLVGRIFPPSQGCIFGRAGLFVNQSTADTHVLYFRWTFRHMFLNVLTCSAF